MAARTALVSALVLAACTDSAPDRNTSDSAAQWTLVEDLRIGGADEGPASFSRVHSVVEAPNGNIFVLELQEQELRVFDKQGVFVRVAARRGAGPGELEYATGMALGPDAVVVNDPRQARYTLVDFDGRFVRQTLAEAQGYGDVWRGAVDSVGRIIDFPVRTPIGGKDPRTGYDRTEDRVRRIYPDGHADTLGVVTCGSPAPTHVYRTPQGYATSFILPFTADPQTMVTQRGTVWCSPISTYQLLHAKLGDSLRTVVTRVVPVHGVPPALRDSVEVQFRRSASTIGTLVDDGGHRLPTSYPALNRIDVDTDGRVWVRQWTDSIPSPIDVFDSRGTQVAVVTAPRALGSQLFITRDHVFDVQRDADDVPTVIRYRISRR
jgi:hypothetical protein